jgi:predicted nuclease with TOPRIM domain
MKKLLAILLCASILTFTGCSDSEGLEERVSKLESEKQVLVAEKRELQDRLSKYETGMVGIRFKLDTLKTDAEFLDRNVDSLKSILMVLATMNGTLSRQMLGQQQRRMRQIQRASSEGFTNLNLRLTNCQSHEL